MKKVYLFLAVLGISATSFAQNLNVQIFDYNGNDITNGVYAVPSVQANHSETDIKFVLKNNSGGAIDVKVRRENITQPVGYTNAMCFGITCFAAEADTTPISSYLATGVNDSSFHGTFFNYQGTTGDLCVTYHIFNASNPSESVSVRAYYGACLTASIAENTSETVSVSAYPNPATESVLIKYNVTGESQLLITDITGKTVKSIRLNANSQSTQVDVSDLNAGIYIYSIQTGSKRISKKLVVR